MNITSVSTQLTGVHFWAKFSSQSFIDSRHSYFKTIVHTLLMLEVLSHNSTSHAKTDMSYSAPFESLRGFDKQSVRTECRGCCTSCKSKRRIVPITRAIRSVTYYKTPIAFCNQVHELENAVSKTQIARAKQRKNENTKENKSWLCYFRVWKGVKWGKWMERCETSAALEQKVIQRDRIDENGHTNKWGWAQKGKDEGNPNDATDRKDCIWVVHCQEHYTTEKRGSDDRRRWIRQ